MLPQGLGRERRARRCWLWPRDLHQALPACHRYAVLIPAACASQVDCTWDNLSHRAGLVCLAVSEGQFLTWLWSDDEEPRQDNACQGCMSFASHCKPMHLVKLLAGDKYLRLCMGMLLNLARNCPDDIDYHILLVDLDQMMLLFRFKTFEACPISHIACMAAAVQFLASPQVSYACPDRLVTTSICLLVLLMDNLLTARVSCRARVEGCCFWRVSVKDRRPQARHSLHEQGDQSG